MKQARYLLLFVLLAMTSCQTKKNDSSKLTVPKAENKFYYVEFVDMDNSSISQKTISLIKKRIFVNGYILTSESNDWQGIKEIDTTELVDLSILKKPFQNVHRFKDVYDYKSNDTDLEKIVITYNKPHGDTVPNFSYHSYKKFGHQDWQSKANPGNFTYKGTANPKEKKLANWIINILVLLTFK